MGLRLAGRTALITGASSGIGAATASVLAHAGCHLLLVGRDESRLSEVARRTGGESLRADLNEPADVERVAAAGTVADLLVNNAGVGWAGKLEAMTAEEVVALIATNLTASVELTRRLVPAMRRRGRGHVVFVSSVAALGVQGEAVYAAGKAGVRTFAASLRHEVRQHGIGVTTVLPGGVRTPFFENRSRPYDRRFPRRVDPEVVADALVRAVERDRREVFVPRWLTAAARIQGALPGTFHSLARRFG